MCKKKSMTHARRNRVKLNLKYYGTKEDITCARITRTSPGVSLDNITWVQEYYEYF